MKFLEELRKKPKETKVIILWSIIAPVGIIFIFIWLYIASNSLKGLSQVSFPEMDGSGFPKKEIEESIKELELFFDEEKLKEIIEEAEKLEEKKEEKNEE